MRSTVTSLAAMICLYAEKADYALYVAQSTTLKRQRSGEIPTCLLLTNGFQFIGTILRCSRLAELPICGFLVLVSSLVSAVVYSLGKVRTMSATGPGGVL